MNSETFKSQILIKRPRYANSRIPIIQAFANKGKSKSEYSQFGPIYELYIYAFILGLKRNLNLPLPNRNLTTEFIEVGKWKRDSTLVDFLLMIIFSHCEEIGFTWNQLEDMEEAQLNGVINDIITFIESYANGGLEYLQKEYEQNNLLNSPYMFIDLLAESCVNTLEYENPTTLVVEEQDEDLVTSTIKLIEQGETSNTEFKSTLRINLHTNQPDDKMELSCIKTLAGFMNTKSGTLLIGISDTKEILGLDADFKSFGNKHDLLDEFQKHLDNLIEKYMGNSAFAALALSFPEIEGKMICRLNVDFRKNGPIFVKNKGIEEFYIRRSASTKALNPSEMMSYIENHWD
ncbi:helix-turn-helix domain-containing protein [Flavobacterium pectinovorum]|uniref:AlbA family DNA-binding domain-containing protein n=1 Tax=Flavobacterium pectinovorum TaxID=29533 RepID=UPI001FAE46B6|nr:ATP-binding protein [Flavobacterium pectinovorum]MCI9843615.1 putative DNA binding domain-containing protein [Flavobacterium pectinovorum]